MRIRLPGNVHFSALKEINKSPAHYQYVSAHGRDDKPFLRSGRLLHSLVFEETNAFAVYDGIRRGKEWEAFKADHADVETIVNVAEHAEANAMAAAIRARPDAVRLLEGDRERYLEWTWLGRPCAGTIDVIGADWVTELKTCRTAKPDWFQRDALRFDYHTQLAWYRNGVAQSLRVVPHRAHIVAVESSPPYPVVVWQLTDRALELGERRARLWLEQLMACEGSDSWPGYCESMIDFDVPDPDESFSINIGGEEVAF